MLLMTKTIPPPSKPPRVSVPVSGETLEVFKRLAKASNQSTGTAIAEWLSDTVEAAELMAATMERARAAPKVVTAELHAMMLGMADQTKELQDKFRKYKGSVEDGPGSAMRSSATGPSAKIPPSCNTGGKLTGEKRQKPKGESF